MATPDEILDFWFEPGRPAGSDERMRKMKRWFMGGEAMGQEIAQRFGSDVEHALAGAYADWEREPESLLALVLLLDQFTRSLFPNTPRSFAGDPKAQELAARAHDAGTDRKMTLDQRLFLLMPFMHAEDLGLSERAVELTEKLVADSPADQKGFYSTSVEQATKYREVIARFGRFPHRNAALGRTPTPEEAEFLRTWQRAPEAARE
jgi:uncharacterized protein (DUF924 family)